MGTEIDGVNGIIKNTTSDGDITIKGNDGGSEISALVFDISAAGAATFNDKITAVGTSVFTNLDISGDIDVDGTTNLDVVDIDGAVDMASTLAVGDNITVTSSTSSKPVLKLDNTNTDANPSSLVFDKSVTGANDDILGRIDFTGQDTGNGEHTFARIDGLIQKANATAESGKLIFQVAVDDTMTEFMRIQGGSGAGGVSEVMFNEGSGDHDFRVESNGNTHMLFVDGGNNEVGINTSTCDSTFHVTSAGTNAAAKFETNSANNAMVILNNTRSDDGSEISLRFDRADTIQGAIGTTSQALSFWTGSSLGEKMRIHSDGNISIGRTTVDTTNAGISLEAAGTAALVRSSGPCLIANRLTDDGEIIRIVQAGTTEGTISTSGSTVSYNAFTGSHWSRLSDNSKPTILRGTIMESLDSMVNWYQAVADVAEVKYTAEDQAVIDGEKNVGDVKTKAHTIKEEIALPDGKSVGDAVTFTHNGTEYTGVYAKENDVKHVHSKISTTADSTRVYGVFHCWGHDNIDDVNDMEIAQVGTYIIRVHKDVTVAAGDLLVSNGDGTAKKQDDDIIRSKTVAKVNSNIKVETYSDGSYTVPCTLHC